MNYSSINDQHYQRLTKKTVTSNKIFAVVQRIWTADQYRFIIKQLMEGMTEAFP